MKLSLTLSIGLLLTGHLGFSMTCGETVRGSEEVQNLNRILDQDFRSVPLKDPLKHSLLEYTFEIRTHVNSRENPELKPLPVKVNNEGTVSGVTFKLITDDVTPQSLHLVKILPGGQPEVVTKNVAPRSQLIQTDKGLFLFEGESAVSVQDGMTVQDVNVKQILVSKVKKSVTMKNVGQIYAENFGTAQLRSVGNYVFLLEKDLLYLLKPTEQGVKKQYLKKFSWKSHRDDRIELAQFNIQKVSIDGKVDLVFDVLVSHVGLISHQSPALRQTLNRQEHTIDFVPYQ